MKKYSQIKSAHTKTTKVKYKRYSIFKKYWLQN